MSRRTLYLVLALEPLQFCPHVCYNEVLLIFHCARGGEHLDVVDDVGGGDTTRAGGQPLHPLIVNLRGKLRREIALVSIVFHRTLQPTEGANIALYGAPVLRVE